MTNLQQELYNAMKNGVVVHYMAGLNQYFFRSDTMKHCTKQARALLKAGLVEEYKKDWRGSKLRVKTK